jgi:hypothetical protein
LAAELDRAKLVRHHVGLTSCSCLRLDAGGDVGSDVFSSVGVGHEADEQLLAFGEGEPSVSVGGCVGPEGQYTMSDQSGDERPRLNDQCTSDGRADLARHNIDTPGRKCGECARVHRTI